MSVSISGLRERFHAKPALEGHVIVVDAQMVSQIAQFWEFEWALLALQDLVHPLRTAVETMDQEVVSLILDLFMVSSVVDANGSSLACASIGVVRIAVVLVYALTVLVN